MKILRVLFLANAAIAGSMLLNSCGGVPEDMPPISGLQAYVKASNTGAADEFGFAVALSIDGNTLVVGAPGEASAGAETDNSAPSAGAVYVYLRSGTTWTQQAYIKASNPEAGDQFGISVALSGNGNTLAVGATGEDSALPGVTPGIVSEGTAGNAAPGAGAVYVFTLSAGTWSQQAYVKASNTGADDQFGISVALSSDGSTLAVGATGEDSALTGVTPGSVSEGTAGNAAPGAGAVYVFTRDLGGVWSQQAYVKASNTDADDQFGISVALNSDGDILAVGAIGESSAATGIGGNQTDNSAADAGAVYVYTRIGTTWTQQAYAKASSTGAGDQFGTSAVLSSDGNTLAVGAIGEDSSAMGIGGIEIDNSATNAGAVYVLQ